MTVSKVIITLYDLFRIFFSAIAIKFDQMSYKTVEGVDFVVCVALVGETALPVEVTLISQQDTATGLISAANTLLLTVARFFRG